MRSAKVCICGAEAITRAPSLCQECDEKSTMASRAALVVREISEFDRDQMVADVENLIDEYGVEYICEIMEELTGVDITVRQPWED